MRGRGKPLCWLVVCVDHTGAKYAYAEASTLLEAQALGRKAADAGHAYLRSTPIWRPSDRRRVLERVSLRGMERSS